MSHDVRTGVLRLTGAQLYYEVRGSGPLLLIIPGGPQDAGVFAGLADLLSDRYTIAAFDPRGNSRSLFEGEPQPLDVAQQADDAAQLVEALACGPALVFGTSGGAQIGLALAARHPQRVRALVAHEPPAIALLADPGPALALEREIHDTYRREGVEAAMGLFFSRNGLGEDDGPPAMEMPPEAAETFARVSGNFDYWLAHGMLALATYRPEVEGLRRGRVPLAIGVGEASAGQDIHAMAMAAAEALDVATIAFPGDHMGYDSQPEAFAAALDGAFRTLADLTEGDTHVRQVR